MPEASMPSIGDLHDDQIVALLRSGAHAALLIAYFGEPEYRELSHLAKLAATRRNPRGRPVFVLPGIMGSRLGRVHAAVTRPVVAASDRNRRTARLTAARAARIARDCARSA